MVWIQAETSQADSKKSSERGQEDRNEQKAVAITVTRRIGYPGRGCGWMAEGFSNRFLHESGSEAARTHLYFFCSPFNEGPDGSKVWTKHPFGVIIRVTDIVPH